MPNGSAHYESCLVARSVGGFRYVFFVFWGGGWIHYAPSFFCFIPRLTVVRVSRHFFPPCVWSGFSAYPCFIALSMCCRTVGHTMNLTQQSLDQKKKTSRGERWRMLASRPRTVRWQRLAHRHDGLHGDAAERGVRPMPPHAGGAPKQRHVSCAFALVLCPRRGREGRG